MERFPNPENNESLKNDVIEAWREKSPDAREKYARWLEIEEARIESEPDPLKYRLKQIKLNIERGDIFSQSGMNEVAQAEYRDAIDQIKEELLIPENDPLKIDRQILNDLLENIKQKK